RALYPARHSGSPDLRPSRRREPPRARADDRGVPPPAARDRAFGAGAPLRAGAVLHLHRLRVLLWDRRAAQYSRFPADRRPCRLVRVVLFDPARRPPVGPHRLQSHVPDRGRDGWHLRVYLFRAARHDVVLAHLSRDRAVADPARHAITASAGVDRPVLYAVAALP